MIGVIEMSLVTHPQEMALLVIIEHDRSDVGLLPK